MPVAPNPDQALLHKLLLGQLPTAEVERLATVYADDGRLAMLAESLVNSDDELLGLLQNHETAAIDPDGERLVERLLERLKPALPKSDTAAINRADASTEPSSPNVTGKPGTLPGLLEYYRPLKVLGQGGMGTVYLAEDTRLGREVAIKTLRPELAINPQAKERFLREARTAAKLEHDHIIPIYSVGEADGTPFLAMPFLKGEPLDALIRRTSGPLPVTLVVRLAREVASGLAAAHERGLIHRDIKPGNIWLEAPTGRAKILDFGLAKAADAGSDDEPETHLTASGAIVGTPAYMAPEQASGHAVDGRADLFSLGCVLYELLSGKRAFSGPTTMSILMSLANHTPPAPDTLNTECPAALSRLVMQLLEKDPAKRPASAAAVIQSLDALETASAAPKPPAATIVGIPVCREASAPGLERTTLPGSGSTPPGPPTVVDHAPTGGEPPVHRTVAISPTSVSSTRKRMTPKQIVAISLGGALLMLFAAVVFRVQTDQGTLVVTIEDAAVQAILEQDGLVIRDKSNDRKWSIKSAENKSFPSGKYQLDRNKNLQLLVTDDSGAEFKTGEFTLKGNGEVRVRVSMEQSVAVAAKETARQTKVPGSAVVAPVVYVESPDFTAWKTEVAALPAEEQLVAVSKKLQQLNPEFDGTLTGWDGRAPQINDGVVTEVMFYADKITNISPVRALVKLRNLECRGASHGSGRLADLTPLHGMPLRALRVFATQVSDLSPLHGMPLEGLQIQITPVADLTPLNGLPLKWLICGATKVSDLSPLAGMPLEFLDCAECPIKDFSPLQTTRLQKLIFWMPRQEGQAALWETLRSVKTLTTIVRDGGGYHYETPAEMFFAQIPAQIELERVVKQLRELNPEYDGAVRYLRFKLEQITDLRIESNHVTNLSPLRELKGLRKLELWGFASHESSPALTDISPLQGLPLTSLSLGGQPVEDITHLKGMPLVSLNLAGSKVKDLSPLKGMPLTFLHVHSTPVLDLAPLADMPLRELSFTFHPDIKTEALASLKSIETINNKPAKAFFADLPAELATYEAARQIREINDVDPRNPVDIRVEKTNIELTLHGVRAPANIEPLKALRELTILRCPGSPITDLKPLAGMRLKILQLPGCKASDLSPLKGMPLTELDIGEAPVTDLSPLAEFPLVSLNFKGILPERDGEVLRSIKTLQHINGQSVAVFWKNVDNQKKQ